MEEKKIVELKTLKAVDAVSGGVDAQVRAELDRWGDELLEYRLPRWSELPEIDLYMDQVILLMEKYLSVLMVDEDRRSLTSTMVNNYVKQGVIPAPVNKKYSRKHLACLIMVCSMKSVLSISAIREIISGRFEHGDVREIYDSFCEQQEEALQKTVEHARLTGEMELGKPAFVGGMMYKVVLRLAVQANACKVFAEKIISLQKKFIKNIMGTGENMGEEKKNRVKTK